MKKLFGFLSGGLKKKTVILVLVMLVSIVAVFYAFSAYQNRVLTDIVGETRIEQQQAISRVSRETMHQVMENTLVSSTALQAQIADMDFAEIMNDTYMLQTMAQGLLERRASLRPAELSLPDPALDGTTSAMVLFEEGVDYTQSEHLAAAGHMSSSMIAMQSNSDKIARCFIGLADGTVLSVDTSTANRFDENGELSPFPVRERPWYRGAVESGGLYFTGIETDAYSGSLCVTCSAPVVVDGEILGVVGIDIVLDSVSDFINSSASSAGFAVIVNDHGQVILAPEGNGLFSITTSDAAPDLRQSENEELARFVTAALEEPTELTLLVLDGREFYAAGAPMPTVGWTMLSFVDKELTESPERTMLEEYDRINNEASAKFWDSSARTRQTGRIVLLLVLLAGVGAALFATGRIVKPLEEMTATIQESARTGKLFEMKDSYRTRDEIQVLAEAFDDLSKKTKKYIEDITEITREKERVNTELDMAKQIQSSMLPHVFPAFPERSEFDIYASMDPAREVGGDFYDYFLVDDDHLCMVIADVSGKGVPAALFMMASKIILANNAKMGKSPAQIMADTNAAICSNNQKEMFVTVWLGILELSTGRLRAANAGHEYPAIQHGDGSFELFRDRHGLVIGAMDISRYREYELQLSPGDRLFVYTDGVPEATASDNSMFGVERMLAALNEDPNTPPEQLLKAVRRAADEFMQGAEQFDDLTMLCLEYRGPAPRPEEQSRS